MNERFIKLMLMTTSVHDGEALNAIRMANRELAAMKLSWRDYLEKSQVRQAPPPPPPPPRPQPRPQPSRTGFFHDQPPSDDDIFDNQDEINQLFERAFARCRPGTSFHDGFLVGINKWWKDKHYLKRKQYEGLVKGARSR